MKKIICMLLLCLCLFCTGCGEKTTEIVISEPEDTADVATAPTTAPKPIELDGSYKGKWEMFDCSGVWADFENYSWDCWAELKDKDLLVWDLDIPKDIGLAKLVLSRDGGEYKLDSGKFMDIESGFESWRVTVEQDDGVKLTLRGRYEGNAEGSYSFAMYLEKEEE